MSHVNLVKKLKNSILIMEPDQARRNNLFRTRVTVKDNGSTDNLISEKAVKKLELIVEEYPKPYTRGWIKTGEGVKD